MSKVGEERIGWFWWVGTRKEARVLIANHPTARLHNQFLRNQKKRSEKKLRKMLSQARGKNYHFLLSFVSFSQSGLLYSIRWGSRLNEGDICAASKDRYIQRDSFPHRGNQNENKQLGLRLIVLNVIFWYSSLTLRHLQDIFCLIDNTLFGDLILNG